MKAVIQRVSKASVTIEGRTIGKIGLGMVVLIGFSKTDSAEHLRIFEDNQQKMNKALLDVGGEILLISQFTLLGDTRKGRRPNFMNAAPPDVAQKLYQKFIQEFQNRKVPVQTGQFQAYMQVLINNDGPVTLILEK